jgi:SecD/SecF fusion protein
MARLFPTPHIDWVKWFKPATAASVILIGIGLVATVARGTGLFDIDLAGGTSVTFILKDSPPESEDNPPGTYVRKRLAKAFEGMVDPASKTRVEYNVYEMEVATQKPRTVYKVDSSLSEVDLLQQTVREALRQPDGSDGLKTFAVDIGDVRLVEPDREPPSISSPDSRSPTVSGEPQNDAKPAEPEADLPPAKEPAADDAAKNKTDTDAEEKSSDCVQEPAAEEGSAKTEPAEETTSEPAAKADELKAKSEPDAKTELEGKSASEAKTDRPAETPLLPEAATQPGTPPPPAPPSTPVPPPRTTQESTAALTFPGSPLSGDALKERVRESARQVLGQDLYVEVYNPNWDPNDNTPYESWTVTLPLSPEQARQVLDHMQAQMEQQVVWQTSSKIGGQVSRDTRGRALMALAVSVLGIIAYIWFRFQKVAWGLAAIVAIAHDALIMLGAIAVSYWLAPYLGFLGIEEFKISLPVVAAFLTLVGYSVNDTIVIFDRLREIRGKSPTITRKMLNDAVNETLSRTIITGGLTWMVVVALYIFGGPGIHAFAFSLVIGVIAGAYSTVYIAAPLLLWLLNRQAINAGAAVEKRDMRQPAA